MGVMPAALAFLDDPPPGVRAVLFEGDRLFNAPFLRKALAVASATLLLVLAAPPDVLAARRRDRRDAKGATFLAGRATKYRNLLAAFPGGVLPAPSARPADLEALVARVLAALSPPPSPRPPAGTPPGGPP
jgi:hypothetical protein